MNGDMAAMLFFVLNYDRCLCVAYIFNKTLMKYRFSFLLLTASLPWILMVEINVTKFINTAAF